MECEIVKLEDYSGLEATVYTILDRENGLTLYEMFVKENIITHSQEVKDINNRLLLIGKVGAREQFFKINEGKPGDGVCALYDSPNSNLRLYCIRFGTQIVILGGGGIKSKTISAFQENKKLTDENYKLRELSKQITEKLKDGDLRITSDYLNFEGEISFTLDNYE